MKTNLITILLFLATIGGFSQNHKFQYSGRYTPSIKKESLDKAVFICEIMPDFRYHFSLPVNEEARLNDLLKLVDAPEGHYIYSQENWFCPQEGYSKIMDYVGIEITAICNGKNISAESTGEALTDEQRTILNTADLGTDINIVIKFKYRDWAIDSHDGENKTKEGTYRVAVVPETEAKYPGGFKQLSEYFTENIVNKIQGASSFEKFSNSVVSFTINEDGKVVDGKLSTTSTDAKIDKLILDAVKEMPKWAPAKNSKGVKVKQVFTIPLGGGGC